MPRVTHTTHTARLRCGGGGAARPLTAAADGALVDEPRCCEWLAGDPDEQGLAWDVLQDWDGAGGH